MTSFTEIDRALSVLDAGFMGKTPSAKFASKMKEKDSYVTGRFSY